MDALVQTCRKSSIPYPHELVPSYRQKQLNSSIYDSLMHLAPNLTQMMQEPVWDLPKAFFSPTFTREGYCYTYNSVNSREIYSDE